MSTTPSTPAIVSPPAVPAPAPAAPARWRSRLLTGLSWVLAVEFVVGGLIKLTAPSIGERFVDWGYPSWFRLVVGAGELVGGALLLSPRRRFLGAALLAVILVGATLTHVVNGDPLSESVSAPLHLVLAATVAWATHPDRYGPAARAGSISAP
jgi:uncharacterized membrane protein YphA (DoxX/SURF4 family)